MLKEVADGRVELDYPPGTPGGKLRNLVEDLGSGGEITLPALEGVPPSALVRWLYRRVLLTAPGWFPLVEVDPTHLASCPDTWWSAAAEGGWLYLGPGSAPPLTYEQRVLVKRLHIQLLRQGEGFLAGVPVDWQQRLLRLDVFHEVAVDPALTWLRRGLLSQSRTPAPTHLFGEVGTELLHLVGWLHSLRGTTPLTVIRTGSERARSGDWLVFNQVEELELEGRRLLDERLRALEEPPRHFSGVEPRRRATAPALGGIVGESPALVQALEQVERLAPHRWPVLVLGEPGVGKEAIARGLHQLSGRRGPFVALDMGALSESLAEAELFGHRRGAFTGAERARVGAFRQAQGGTLFLDEIGSTSPAIQGKLLRVLQEGMVLPVGEDEAQVVDVRIVAATNADLSGMVQRGTFRADLLDRLSGVVVEVPPLRERAGDLVLLAHHFLAEVHPGRTPSPWCSPEVLELLEHHRWPGNVRELANVVRAAAIQAGPDTPLQVEHLGGRLGAPAPLFTLSSREVSEGGRAVPRRTVQGYGAVTFSVPALRDRDLASRRSHILALLGGRPVEPTALRVLEQQPWWGNTDELVATLSVLRHLPPGPVDLALLRTHLPGVVPQQSQAPIRVLISPTSGTDGKVEGLTRDFFAGSLLVGRVRHVDELRALATSGDRRVARWLEAVREMCGDVSPNCLELSLLARLSRAHLVVTRHGDGLRVGVLPGVNLPVEAGPLQVGAALAPVEVGRMVELGPAGEIRVAGRGSAPYLQLFVFLGGVTFEERAGLALLRTRTSTEGAPMTVERTFALPEDQANVAAPGLHVWPLEKAEQEALISLLITFGGGQLKSHVARLLPGLRSRGMERLADYLDRSPRLSQYLVRLIEYPANLGMVHQLRVELARLPDREVRLFLWPEGLRRLVEPS